MADSRKGARMTTIDPTNQPLPKPRRRHGLGAEGIEALRSRQDGKCAICQRPETDAPGGRLAVDHDHAHCPGKIGCPVCVRGLLCVSCNNLLRAVRDDQQVLRAAMSASPSPGTSKRRVEDLPVTELLRRLRHDGPDPRLMPRQGRRDRFFMMYPRHPDRGRNGRRGRVDAGQRPSWLPVTRSDGRTSFYGGPGALDAHLAKILPQTPDDTASRAFFQEVAVERAKLGMSSPGMPGGQVTLGDLNRYLRALAREDKEAAGGSPTR